jgi:hypothetical protein
MMKFSDIVFFNKNAFPDIWDSFQRHLTYTQEQILKEVASEIDGGRKLKILAERRKSYYIKLQDPMIRFSIAFFDGGFDEVAKDVDAKFRREIYLNASDSKTEKRQIIYLNGIKPFLDKIQKKDFSNPRDLMEESQKFLGCIAEWHELEEPNDITISNAIEQTLRPPSQSSVTQAIANYFEIHTWQLLLQWLDEIIQHHLEGTPITSVRIGLGDKPKKCIPIHGNLNSHQITRAFDFLKEVKIFGQTLMEESDVEKLKEIGLCLPKSGAYQGEKFKISGKKGVFFNFFYELWHSHTFKLRRSNSKEEIALFLKTYFEEVANLSIESILAQMKKGKLKIFKSEIQDYIPPRSSLIG